MLKLIVLPFIIIFLMLLTSCDERSGIRPEIEVNIVNDHLYSDGGNCNLDSTVVNFQLTGSSGFISEVKIMVEYNKTTSLFVGTGSEDFIITDGDGFAQGTYKVTDTLAYGVDNFQASLERFPSVREEKLIHIDLLPDILIHVESESIQTEGSVTVLATLIDQFDNVVSGQEINFSADKGSFLIDTPVETNEQGIAENTYVADSEPGTVEIEVSMDICSEVSNSITIIVE